MAHAIRRLIINADDFNVTRGVSQGIVRAIDKGVVTSTTVLVNTRYTQGISLLSKKKNVSIGLHFNITKGKPVACGADIEALSVRGFFPGLQSQSWYRTRARAIKKELTAQIERFSQWFSKKPSHIDSHHHVHANPAVYEAVKSAALSLGIPIRKRALDKTTNMFDCATTDYALYRFDPACAWTEASLVRALKNVQKGITELIVHPGLCDKALCARSSFNKERKRELDALLSETFYATLRKENIQLITFKEIRQ